MGDLLTFVGVFALAGGLFFWLKRLGRRMEAQAAAGRPQAGPGDDGGDDGDALAENLGFAAENLAGLARSGSRRSPRDPDSSDRGEGGGDDGGGGDGGG